MKRTLTVALTLAALPMGVGVAAATTGGGNPGDGCHKHGGDKRAHECPTTGTTETEPGTTTTVTETQTVTTPGTTVTVTTPAPPPTVVVTPGPVNNTVTITITINGVPQTVTVPGTVPGTKPACVNTLKSAKLGPLPQRFSKVKHVTVVINGHSQARTVLPGRRVNVSLAGLACGTYPIVVNDSPNSRAVVPVLRIWSLDGGTKLVRAGFPEPVPPIGLS